MKTNLDGIFGQHGRVHYPMHNINNPYSYFIYYMCLLLDFLVLLDRFLDEFFNVAFIY